MEVVLRGSSPGTATAGIMLLTRARQLGLPLSVGVIRDPADELHIPGPVALYAPVLASCGVGREHGHGAFVVVPGPPGVPVLMTATPHGVGGWFEVTRTGEGCHPATRAYVRMCNDPRVPSRKIGKDFRRVLTALGMSTEPAVLDVLFGAQVAPLTRLSLALRAGRSLSGGRGQPITRYITGWLVEDRDPLPHEFDRDAFLEQADARDLQWILNGLSPVLRDAAEEWVDMALKLAREDDGRDLELLYRVVEMASHLVQLPPHSILPPLGAAEDSVAVGIQAALNAEGAGDASEQLVHTFQFLGGRYVSDASHWHDVVCEPPPDPEDSVGRWQWFCGQVRQGRKDADALWPIIVDPPQ
ncbi:MAG: hypothetical protein JRJ84_00875 [Deltaproteobacteria bacterium]|nr:hypothetical protein [Deltaproteobacteria bacterium]